MSALLNELLDPRQVTLDLRAETCEDAILEIVETLRANGGVKNYYEFAAAVMDREGRSSTNTGEGVAFPHARTDLVEQLVLAIGRSTKGVPFGNNAPVHLIFLIGVPQRMVNDYLVCVGAIARLVKNKQTREALMAAEAADAFVELLRSGSLLLE